jgi:beta-lactamase class A
MTTSGILCPNKFTFISPDLNCIEDPQDQTVALEQSVTSVVHDDVLIGEADRVSVFYRDLNNKQWFGVNENDRFAPGSLLKLPLAIAYFKSSEIES